jgi:hypothetical protein
MTLRTIIASLALFLLSTASVHAQVHEISGTTVPQYLDSIKDFIVGGLVPLVFAVAFVTFIWGIFLYFIAGGANEEKRDQGKQLAIWGIVAFFVMISVWGIVNVLVGTFGFGNKNAPNLPSFNPGSTGTYGPQP